jgi:predicted  nucleic acid-binding Zn-ribbon protein
MDQSQQTDHQNEASAVAPRAERPSLHSLARVIQSSLADGAAAKAQPAPAPRAETPATHSADFASTIDSVRRVSEALRAAEQRSNDLQAGLQALTDRARREITAADERVRVANERADVAEERARQAEERLAQVMELIQREFAALTPAQAPRATSAA